MNNDIILELQETIEEQQAEFDRYRAETDKKINDLLSRINTNEIFSKPIKGKEKEPSFFGAGGLITLNQKKDNRNILAMFSGTSENIYSTKNVQRDENTFLYLVNSTDKNQASNPSFISATGTPTVGNIGGNINIKATDTSIVDKNIELIENELSNSYIIIIDPSIDNTYVLRKVISNTKTTIQLDKAIGLTIAGAQYISYHPVLMGSAQFPFRRLYVGDDTFGGIRFGGGPTGVLGTPSDNGSLYMKNTDGNLYFRRKDGTEAKIT